MKAIKNEKNSILPRMNVKQDLWLYEVHQLCCGKYSQQRKTILCIYRIYFSRKTWIIPAWQRHLNTRRKMQFGNLLCNIVRKYYQQEEDHETKSLKKQPEKLNFGIKQTKQEIRTLAATVQNPDDRTGLGSKNIDGCELSGSVHCSTADISNQITGGKCY